LEFHAFDANYVQRLTAGDAATEAHFSAYFSKFLFLKMRSRTGSQEWLDDVRQETLFRVLKALRQGSGVTQPERFGAFVNAVCNHVMLEFSHQRSRHPLAAEDAPETADERVDLDASLVTTERKRLVAQVLDELAPKDREILRLVFFEELERGAICDRLGVEPEYLRVLLHRAKSRFQAVCRSKLKRIGQALLLVTVWLWV
jgi:RNA polymerase sigma-70 factor, ECF subfamily